MTFQNLSKAFSSYCTPVQVKIVLIILNIIATIVFLIITNTGSHPYRNLLDTKQNILLTIFSFVLSFVLLAVMIYLCKYGYIKIAWAIVAIPFLGVALLILLIVVLLLLILVGKITGVMNPKQLHQTNTQQTNTQHTTQNTQHF